VCEATPKASKLPFGELENARVTMRVKMYPFMYDGRKCSILEHKGTRTGNGIVSMSTGWFWTPPVGSCLEPKSSFSVDGMSDEKQEDLEREKAGIKFDCLEGTEKDRQINFMSSFCAQAEIGTIRKTGCKDYWWYGLRTK
jgi:hypothetical protein